MRILVVSNLYPPHHIGGYELGCRDVVDALRQRGHDVSVLTSRFGIERPRREAHVHRWLPIDLVGGECDRRGTGLAPGDDAGPRASFAFVRSLLHEEACAWMALRWKTLRWETLRWTRARWTTARWTTPRWTAPRSKTLPRLGAGGQARDQIAGTTVAVDVAARNATSASAVLGQPISREAASRARADVILNAAPDVVYVWNMRYLPMSIVRYAQRMGLPVCYYVSDDWLARWETVDRWEQWAAHLPSRAPGRQAKRLLRAAVNRVRLAGRGRTIVLDHVQFASAFLQRACVDAGLEVAHPLIVHWGVDTTRFRPRDDVDAVRLEPRDDVDTVRLTLRNGLDTAQVRSRDHRDPSQRDVVRLLYAGQVTRAKGVDTAIEAFRLLTQTLGSGRSSIPIDLSIVGGTVQPDYEAALRARVREAGLESRVHFTGAIDRTRMPDLYRDHDVLIFPSRWDEPFSITLLEAMASGLAVVATATGGSAEILRDDVNALVFSPDDAAACATHVRSLIERPDLRARLGAEARRTVEQRFDLERMIDVIELDLHEAAGA